MSPASPYPAHLPASLRSLLEAADVRLDGARPWDVAVRDDRLMDRVLSQGTLGFGEAYMDGWWECGRIDEMIFRLLRADLYAHLRPDWRMLLRAGWSFVRNMQTRSRSRAVAERHYDLGNDFYAAMLDPLMQYSCGYFDGTDDLAEAQRRKLDLIRRKLYLAPGMHLLDIGCGWGGLAQFMAQEAGCRVTGVNISREQILRARERTAGLPVDILEQDYRDLQGSFDAIVSVGMFEHVGYRNYRSFMETAHRLLPEGGLFLLHTIGYKRSGRTGDPWLHRYIFPNSHLPSAAQITQAAEGLFILEDWHNFGTHYDKTLLAWNANFEAAWPRFADRYGERFRRMWRYYLLSCAGAFRARETQLWQIVLSKRPREGYVSVG